MKKLLLAAGLALTGLSANAQFGSVNTIHYAGYVSNIYLSGHNSSFSTVPYLFSSASGGTTTISTSMTTLTIFNSCFNEDINLSAVDAAAPGSYYRYVIGCGSPLIGVTKNADHDYTFFVEYPLGG